MGSIFIWYSMSSLLYQRVSLSLVQEMFQGNISVPASLQFSAFSLGLMEVSTVSLSNPAQGCIVHRVNFH